MTSSIDRFGGGDISVGINIDSLLLVVLTSKGPFLSLFLFHYHSVVVSTGWNYHGCIRVTSMHSLIKHDVLRIILSKKKVSGKFEKAQSNYRNKRI